jgi:subtilisin family serine protease
MQIHMKPLLPILAFFLCFSIAEAQQTFSKNRLLVKVKETARSPEFWSQQSILTVNNEYNVSQTTALNRLSHNDLYVIHFETEQDIHSAIQSYRETGLFSIVEPDYIGHGGGKMMTTLALPNDQYFERQWGLVNDGTFTLSNATNDSDIDMELGWDIEKGSSDIVVAVLDSGVKLNHPELKDRLWQNNQETTLDGIDNDQNGYIDDTNGWDFANGDRNPMDDHGHGSNVTGIVGAEANNEIGYAGVDQNCRLMIGKILDSNNSGSYSWWIEAIYYAVDNGARVINMSVGGSSYSSLMQEVVDYAYDHGVTIVACMMNFNVGQDYYPAAYQNTIAVGSTNADDSRTEPFFWDQNSGSNFGPHLDLVAPGNFIYGLRYNSDTNFNTYWGGTSQSTPLVTGVAALLLAQDPSRTPDDIRNILNSTAEDMVGDESDEPGWDPYYGNGRLNAHAALSFGTTSTDRLEDHLIFEAHPNPIRAGNEFTINGIEGNEVSIKIYTMNGRLISKDKHPVANRSIKMPFNQKAGTYYLQVIQSDGHKGGVVVLVTE